MKRIFWNSKLMADSKTTCRTEEVSIKRLNSLDLNFFKLSDAKKFYVSKLRKTFDNIKMTTLLPR